MVIEENYGGLCVDDDTIAAHTIGQVAVDTIGQVAAEGGELDKGSELGQSINRLLNALRNIDKRLARDLRNVLDDLSEKLEAYGSYRSGSSVRGETPYSGYHEEDVPGVARKGEN